MMTARRILTGLVRVVTEEAERNSDFNARLKAALGISEMAANPKRRRPSNRPAGENTRSSGVSVGRRSSSRRPPALLDPVHLARQSESILRTELGRLDLEQLRDIVADYGMDTGKLVMKWRDTDRIVDRIVEVSMARSQKGSAFRDQAEGAASTEKNKPS
jgi:hypothetical protein